MVLSDSDIAELTMLEESMWRAGTRYDRAWLEKVWAADMVEFGRSGHVYGRDELMDAQGDDIPATLPLPDFRITPLDADTVLVTYVSELLRGRALERSNRSSIWSRTPEGWRMRFHQGTPVADN